MTRKCDDCGNRHRASGRRCLACKTQVHREFRDAKKRGWVIDMAGGAWWVWDKLGNVLATHETSNVAALRLALNKLINTAVFNSLKEGK